MPVTRFFQQLDIQLQEGRNQTAIDLFDIPHARKVLTAFGRAYRENFRRMDPPLDPAWGPTTAFDTAESGETQVRRQLRQLLEVLVPRQTRPAGDFDHRWWWNWRLVHGVRVAL